MPTAYRVPLPWTQLWFEIGSVDHAMACIGVCVYVYVFAKCLYCGRTLLEDRLYDPSLPWIAVGKPLHGTVTATSNSFQVSRSHSPTVQ